MKKIIIIISSIFIITATIISFVVIRNNYSPNDKVKTIIIDNKNMVVGINYPITNIYKLNRTIKKNVNKIYKNFKNSYRKNNLKNNRSELNIDYKIYNLDNKYISIKLDVFEFINNKEKKQIITYFFDIKNNKFLLFNDIVSNKEFNKNIKTKYNIKNKPNNLFTISNSYLTIYIEEKEKYKSIKIPLENINFLFDIELGTDIKTKYKKVNAEKNVIDINDKIIALTFDDGPSKYTDEILNLLDKYNANATFFVLGNKVELYKETINKSIINGNEIGNHSYNHKWLIKLKKEEFLDQINKTQDIMKKTFDYTPKVLRPTYGSINSLIRENTNLRITLWNVDTLDWKYKNPKTIASRVIGHVKDGSIVLMHDTHKQTVKALEMILNDLSNEYKFVTVSELDEVNLLRKQLGAE